MLRHKGRVWCGIGGVLVYIKAKLHPYHTLPQCLNPLASEKIRTDSRIREIQALAPFN